MVVLLSQLARLVTGVHHRTLYTIHKQPDGIPTPLS